MRLVFIVLSNLRQDYVKSFKHLTVFAQAGESGPKADHEVGRSEAKHESTR